MKTRQSTIENGWFRVERKDNLISQYVGRQLHAQTLIPEGTTEDRVVAVMESLSLLPMKFLTRR